MKKLFTLIAIAMMAVGAQAQTITFTETASAGSLDGVEIGSDGFTIKVTDPDKKVVIDENSQYFGTATEYTNYGLRINTKGKSTSTKNFITVKVPSAGKLTIAARSGKKGDTTRTLTVKKGDTTLLDAFVLDDSDAVTVKIGEEDKSVFPYVDINVTEAGEYTVSYGAAIYIYAFIFEGSTTGIESITAVENENAPMYNVAGQLVDDNYKGVVVKNGKKFINK
ncbi:MAG: hypothetical protein IKZ61_09570 [Prevotella sp.]|nr:hypothetical protein [Prevotella sp.]